VESGTGVGVSLCIHSNEMVLPEAVVGNLGLSGALEPGACGEDVPGVSGSSGDDASARLALSSVFVALGFIRAWGCLSGLCRARCCRSLSPCGSLCLSLCRWGCV